LFVVFRSTFIFNLLLVNRFFRTSVAWFPYDVSRLLFEAESTIKAQMAQDIFEFKSSQVYELMPASDVKSL